MKNVIITGGTSGIGLSCINVFKNNNYNVIVLSRTIPENKIENVNYYKCDISNQSEVENCINKIKSKYKNIDVLINNAGIQISDSFENYDVLEWKNIMNTNYFGTCNVIYNVTKIMKNNGKILNMLSVHSSLPRTNKYAYDSSKSALEILTKELALHFAPKGITINALSFGAVNTNMNKEWEVYPERKQIARSKVPLNIIFEPDEIANICYNIINNFSEYTTGSIFVVDGGRSLL